jgi:predicted extracellular nuclease
VFGVRVICGSASKPAVGNRVVVTGVSSTYYERGSLWKALLMTEIDPM